MMAACPLQFVTWYRQNQEIYRKKRVLHLFRWFTHTDTHTPSRRRVENKGPDHEMIMKKRGNENEMKMKMR